MVMKSQEEIESLIQSHAQKNINNDAEWINPKCQIEPSHEKRLSLLPKIAIWIF